MYSKNDYRYYLENQLMHSDDMLAHYGIKGMKWKKHKQTNYDPNTGDWSRTSLIGDNKGHAIALSKQHNSRTGKTGIGLTYVNSNKKEKYTPSINKVGRISTSNTGNSKTIAIDTSNKKKVRKKKVTNLIKAGKQLAGAAGAVGLWNGAVEYEWRKAEQKWRGRKA